MRKFQINETNKTLWDKNFVKVDGSDDVQSCGDDGIYRKAEPLNPVHNFDIEITKHGY